MSTDTQTEPETPEAPPTEKIPRGYERYAWGLIAVAGIAGVLIGLWEFFVGPLDTTPGFTADPAFFRAHLFFLLGFSAFATALAAIPYRRGERWAWYVLWIGLIVVLGDAVMNYTAGGTVWPGLVLLSVLIVLGLLLPYRMFFPK